MKRMSLQQSAVATELAWHIARALVLLLPTFLLSIATMRSQGQSATMLAFGTAFQGLVCMLSFLSRRSWQQSIGPSIITLYLIALCWLWWGEPVNDWYTNLAKAILLVMPLLVFAYQTLHGSGAPAIRRAILLSERLAQRHEWPKDLAAIRTLPEVKALRAALTIDAAPALSLLSHPRTEVRIAALAALEFRKDWQPGHADIVLHIGLTAEQPALRAAALYALGNVEERALVEKLAELLLDPTIEVRRAALEAILWDSERRWGWIRYVARRAVGDPMFQQDGPFWHEGQLLAQDAVNDLTAWAAEKGVLASRAASTLAAHYNRALAERGNNNLVKKMREQVVSTLTPAVLRIELGRVLQQHQELDLDMLSDLLAPTAPSPLRMVAIETVLAEENEGTLHDAAVAALRDLARLPNREIAMATADVIQRRLGVDLGLGLNQPLPPIHSRQAADITRKVMVWATQDDEEDVANSRPPARYGV